MRLLPIVIGIAMSIPFVTQASTSATISQEYSKSTPTMTKLEALRILINDPSAVIFRCTRQEITEKATLRNVKKKK